MRHSGVLNSINWNITIGRAQKWEIPSVILFNLYNIPMRGTLSCPFYKSGSWVSERSPTSTQWSQKLVPSMSCHYPHSHKTLNKLVLHIWSLSLPLSFPTRNTFFKYAKDSFLLYRTGKEKIEFKWLKLVKCKTIKYKILKMRYWCYVNMLYLIMAWWWH